MRSVRLRIAVAVVALAAFLAAGWVGVGHVACADHHDCDAVANADADGDAPHPDHDADHCAVCRVAGMVPAVSALPAPLPLPEAVIAPKALAPYEAPRPVVARLSLARGPPASTPA